MTPSITVRRRGADAAAVHYNGDRIGWVVLAGGYWTADANLETRLRNQVAHRDRVTAIGLIVDDLLEWPITGADSDD